MIPVSPRYRTAIRQSHRRFTRVQAWSGRPALGVLINDNVPISGGSLEMTDANAITRSLTVTVADPSLRPLTADSPLTPFGTWLSLDVGLIYADRTAEHFRLFAGPVVEIPDSDPAGPFDVKCDDVVRLLTDARLLDPFSPEVGESVTSAVDRLVADAYGPGLPVTWLADMSGYTAEGAWEQDRWQAIRDMVQRFPALMRASRFGDLEVVPDVIPTIPSTADGYGWVIDAGDRGVLVTTERTWDRALRYNACVAYSAPQDGETPQLRGYAYETTGPTRWDGPYGRRPRYYSSSLLTDQAMVDAAAASVLAAESGKAVDVNWTASPNPALEVGDVVGLRRPGHETVIPHRLTQLTVPLGAGEVQSGSMFPLVPEAEVSWLKR